MTRFVDASVFVHAYLRPRRALQPHELRIKEGARGIVARISGGEAVATSVVHFGEIANVLEDWMSIEDARAVQVGLFQRDTIELLSVRRVEILEALSLAAEFGAGTSDALAVALMRANGISEVYSFDRDFDGFPGVRRLAE